jgi:hypothetical protein
LLSAHKRGIDGKHTTVRILPDPALAIAPSAVRRVAIRQPALTWRIGILTGAGRSLSPAAARLVEMLV